MKTMLSDTWAEFWGERSSRERTLLTAGGALLGVALCYSVLWAPAEAGRATAAQQLPAMQRQLAQMTAQANEARALSSSATGAAPSGSALHDAMLGSFASHGLPPGRVIVNGNAVQVELSNAPFGAWIGWLDEMRKHYKVQVVEAHVSALKEDGQVDLRATLQPTQSK